MNKRQVISSLNKIAEELDNNGLYVEASTISNVMKKVAQVPGQVPGQVPQASQDLTKKIRVSIGIQDMISSFYKARTLNFHGMKKGKVFSFECFMDDEVYDLKIKYVGTEDVKIRKGKFKCFKFVPVVQTGRYFHDQEDVKFWVTADKNRIPILVKAKIPVGTVKMHLVEWNGLKNPLTSKIER